MLKQIQLRNYVPSSRTLHCQWLNATQPSCWEKKKEEKEEESDNILHFVR